MTPTFHQHREQSASGASVEELAAELLDRGYVEVPRLFADREDAWQVAWSLFAGARSVDPVSVGLPEYDVLGQFTIPPAESEQRDFQALHIDFGLPRLTGATVTTARFTALFVDPDSSASGATTRIASLRRLFRQRAWPDPTLIADQLRRTATNGATVEGILGRIIETIDQSFDLPPLDSEGFQCGMEFASLADEHRYFADHGMRLAEAEDHVVLHPGQLLVIDNLAVAHGRTGRRQPDELHQLCIGFPALNHADQHTILRRVLPTG